MVQIKVFGCIAVVQNSKVTKMHIKLKWVTSHFIVNSTKLKKKKALPVFKTYHLIQQRNYSYNWQKTRSEICFFCTLCLTHNMKISTFMLDLYLFIIYNCNLAADTIIWQKRMGNSVRINWICAIYCFV